MSLFDMFNSNPFLAQDQGGGGGGGVGYNQFPIQQFQDDNFASFMNPMQNLASQMPQTQNYFSALSQAPTIQNSQPSLGRFIGSALAGLAQSVTNPGAGAAIAAQGMRAPYENKVEDYQRNIQNLGRAAQGEQGLMGLSRQLSNDEFARSQQGAENQFKWSELSQRGSLGNRELDVKDKTLQQQVSQQALERALQEKKISVDQYQAATQRINANSNASRDSAMSKYYEQMGNAKENPIAKTNAPNAALIEQQYGARIMSDPILAEYLTADGNFKPGLKQDPNAMERLREIQRELGLLPNNNIGLK